MEKGRGGEEESAQELKPWHSYLPRSLIDSNDAAIRFVELCIITLLLVSVVSSLRDHIPKIRLKYSTYESAVFHKFKDGLASGLQHPTMTADIAFAAVFLLFRGIALSPPSFCEVDPCEDLSDDDIQTAIQNATSPKSFRTLH